MGLSWTGPWVPVLGNRQDDPLSSLCQEMGPFIKDNISPISTEERLMGSAEVISLGISRK